MVTSDLHWEMVPGHYHLLKVSVSRSRPWIPQVSPPGEGNQAQDSRGEPILQVGVTSGRETGRGLLVLQSRRVMLVAGIGGGECRGRKSVSKRNSRLCQALLEEKKISEHVFLEEPLVCGMNFCYDCKMLSLLCKLFIGCLLWPALPGIGDSLGSVRDPPAFLE